MRGGESIPEELRDYLVNEYPTNMKPLKDVVSQYDVPIYIVRNFMYLNHIKKERRYRNFTPASEIKERRRLDEQIVDGPGVCIRSRCKSWFHCKKTMRKGAKCDAAF